MFVFFFRFVVMAIFRYHWIYHWIAERSSKWHNWTLELELNDDTNQFFFNFFQPCLYLIVCDIVFFSSFAVDSSFTIFVCEYNNLFSLVIQKKYYLFEAVHVLWHKVCFLDSQINRMDRLTLFVFGHWGETSDDPKAIRRLQLISMSNFKEKKIKKTHE